MTGVGDGDGAGLVVGVGAGVGAVDCVVSEVCVVVTVADVVVEAQPVIKTARRAIVRVAPKVFWRLCMPILYRFECAHSILKSAHE